MRVRTTIYKLEVIVKEWLGAALPERSEGNNMFGNRRKIDELRIEVALLEAKHNALEERWMSLRGAFYKKGYRDEDPKPNPKPEPDDGWDVDEEIAKLPPDQQELVMSLPEYKKFKEKQHFKSTQPVE